MNDNDIIAAVKGIRFYTAVYHLRLEEALSGKHVDDPTSIASQAIRLADMTLYGGQISHERVSDPFRRPELRSRAETIKSLLMELKGLGTARLKDSKKPGIGMEMERRFEVLFREIFSKTKELENIIEAEETANVEKYRRIYLGILSAWAVIILLAAGSLWRVERERRRAEERLMAANEQLVSQSAELTHHREQLAGLVETRTAELRKTNEQLVAEITERRQTEVMLKETEVRIRHLSSHLIDAQETERQRLSMELHDGLGQALNATKLHIRLIEKKLREDQPAIREECEDLLKYMDGIIEDVRRLSLNLSPSILKDLGLTSAIKWLVSDLSKTLGIEITSHIPEIDHLFCQNHWITVYRVIQEAFANIGKHAGAENASLVIERRNGGVTFFVADDGQGFDPKQTGIKQARERGLGLTTMNERVRMMGGTLDLWSEEGNGTRITFSIPVETEGL